jgi:hypothetical protein
MRKESSVPFVLGGVLVALVLILLGSRLGGVVSPNPVLLKQFEAQAFDPNAPTPAPFQLPQVSLPSLPADVRQGVSDMYNRYTGGDAVPGLTPVATGARLRMEIAQVQRQGEEVRVTGSVSNVSSEPVTVPAEAFAFQDSAGTRYSVQGSGRATLEAGQSTSFDLSVPIPPARGLTLILDLPPDPPLEQVLVAEPKS